MSGMQPTPVDHLPRFSDPALEDRAQEGLNQLVLTLFQRAAQPEAGRPDRIGSLHVIDTPALADEAFRRPEQFQKNFALVAALGQSRFNLNAERWMAFRDRTQPGYNRASKPDEFPAIEAIYRDAVEQLPATDGAALEAALARGALAVFCRALGITPDPDAVLRLFPHIRTHAKMLQFFSWTGAQQPDVLAGRTLWLDRRFNEVVQADPNTTAFLWQAIGSRDDAEWSPAVTDLMQNLFAGIETTVATLSWAVRLLGQNAALQDALRAEADLPADCRPLTRGFLWETMRCFPPIPFVVRQISSDYTGHGRHFAGGDQVLLSILGLHRHPAHWTDPNEFHAARAEFAEGRPTPPAFRPFLSGPRVCGGKRLAEIELLAALPVILRHWTIPATDADIAYDYALALRPRGLDRLHLQARPA